jgi:hypothetical protein
MGDDPSRSELVRCAGKFRGCRSGKPIILYTKSIGQRCVLARCRQSGYKAMLEASLCMTDKCSTTPRRVRFVVFVARHHSVMDGSSPFLVVFDL